VSRHPDTRQPTACFRRLAFLKRRSRTRTRHRSGARTTHPAHPSPRSRQVYVTLLPYDRGDFRWEFLAPWSNKTLTPVDKLIICTAFIGSAFGLQQLFEPGSSVGVHASYIAQFFS
jgi:hypothetical protein